MKRKCPENVRNPAVCNRYQRIVGKTSLRSAGREADCMSLLAMIPCRLRTENTSAFSRQAPEKAARGALVSEATTKPLLIKEHLFNSNENDGSSIHKLTTS